MKDAHVIDDRRSEAVRDAMSPDRVRCLYEITKLLARFESQDVTVPAVLERLSETLALRSAILILGERNAQPARTLVWPEGKRTEAHLRGSFTHVEASFAYLAGEQPGAQALIRGAAPRAETPPQLIAEEAFIVLPLVVEHDRVFGALQLEPSRRGSEADLLLANVVVNQLALALDRQATIEARLAAEAAEKASAEAQRDMAETLRGRLEGLLDNLDHAFAWEADETLKILFVSANAERLIGFPRDRWVAAPSFWSECVHSEDRAKLTRMLESTFSTETNQRCEHRCLTADGREVWLRTGVHLASNGGGPRRLQGVSVDITTAKRLESALREADRHKNEFLAMLAHELRNPLAPIVNAAELLRPDSSPDPHILEQARAIIERQAAQMTRLIDDLLDVARITSGKIKLKMAAVTINGVVQRALDTVRPLIALHGHRLTLSVPAEDIWIEADAARLEQVMQNLLHNAAKYTPDGGQIAVTVQLDGSAAVVRVRDTGVGIPSELLPHVFEMFTQAATHLDRAGGGLGIGLALVKRLVVMHGGEIEVESTVGQGSEFRVRVPAVTRPPRTASAPVAGLAPETAHLRVLVVDDNADSAASLAMLLEASGHIVSVAHGGVAALSLAEKIRPQVAFLDIGLPELDGYEVAKRLRLAPGLAHIMLVALTGYGRPRDLLRSRAAGFDHHVVKPADFGRLKTILSEAAASPH
jgi:PAS domain S-box-containing protein